MRAWLAPGHGARHARRVVATVVVLVVAAVTGGLITAVSAVAAAVMAQPVPQPAPRPVIPSVAQHDAPDRTPLPAAVSAARPTVLEAQALPAGEPARVVIPAIGVDVALVELGLRADRAMEVPAFGLAGWYAKGPRPGHPGPAVLAGHVDSRAGPDVFFRLRELVAGDRVHVVYDSGDRVTFVVTRSERTPKEALPVASIWPLTTERLLALITCGGSFDRSVRSYRDNIIVYATPA